MVSYAVAIWGVAEKYTFELIPTFGLEGMTLTCVGASERATTTRRNCVPFGGAACYSAAAHLPYYKLIGPCHFGVPTFFPYI